MKKFLDRFRNIQFKDIVNKENLFAIALAEAIFWSPAYVSGILGFIFQNNWLLGIATGYLAFWALPFVSPAILLQIALIYFIRRILKWMKTKSQWNKKR